MFHLADAWATWAITWVGGRHVMVGAFDPAAVFKTMAERKVTVTNLVPTMLNDLVNHPDSRDIRVTAFRLVMSGGAPISPQLVQRVIDTFRCEYVQTYGLTETSPYLTFSLLNEHLRHLPPDDQMRYRSMTGRPALGVELRLVDEEGNDVPADGCTVGEIIARGDRITPGYWRLPDATAEAFRDGWFHTGDLATVEGEGYFNIVDRKKEVILTGGELVYSTEVENALWARVSPPSSCSRAANRAAPTSWRNTAETDSPTTSAPARSGSSRPCRRPDRARFRRKPCGSG